MDEKATDPKYETLREFFDGLEEKLKTEVGRMSSHEVKREVKREIARKLGVEEAYVPGIRSSVNDSDATRQARRKVRHRYKKLRSEEKVVEDGEVAEQTKRLNEWMERIDAHIRGEECFYSEDIPHADWSPGKSSDDSSDDG